MIGDTDPDAGLLGWVLRACATIGATLVGAIVFLSKLFISQTAKRFEEVQISHTEELSTLRAQNGMLEKRSEVCEQDREALRISQAVLEARINVLEKEMHS